jgi:hypothetical protein
VPKTGGGAYTGGGAEVDGGTEAVLAQETETVAWPLAEPDDAVITAVPLELGDVKTPLIEPPYVVPVVGETVPIEALRLTAVPSGAGLPLPSRTDTAMVEALPQLRLAGDALTPRLMTP